jgi:ribose transport system substrate-binding protein
VSSSSSSSGPSSASSDSGSIAVAQRLVADNTKLATAFKVPGPPIKGGAKSVAAGKSIWYIPVTVEPPWFDIQSKVQQSVWSMLGATVHVCDGADSPTNISSCLREAVSNKAAAVITDSIPVPFAQDAYTAVVNAKIPVIAGYTDKDAAPTTGNFGKYFVPVSGLQTQTQQLGAAEAIVDSRGRAKVLVAGANDVSSATAASYAAANYLKSSCPGCTVDSFLIKTVANPNLASEVSGQILRHPEDDYLYTPYEAPSGTLFLQAIRQAGRHMTFMSTAGDIAGLERVKQGAQVADVGLDPVFEGWSYVDAALRALAGMPPVQHIGILRLFTKANVPQTPSLSGWLSGTYYSNLEFESVYKKAWGVS